MLEYGKTRTLWMDSIYFGTRYWYESRSIPPAVALGSVCNLSYGFYVCLASSKGGACRIWQLIYNSTISKFTK